MRSIAYEVEHDHFFNDNNNRYRCSLSLRALQYPIYCDLNDKYYEAAHIYYYLRRNKHIPGLVLANDMSLDELKKHLLFHSNLCFAIYRRHEAIYEEKMIKPLQDKIRKASHKIV